MTVKQYKDGNRMRKESMGMNGVWSFHCAQPALDWMTLNPQTLEKLISSPPTPLSAFNALDLSMQLITSNTSSDSDSVMIITELLVPAIAHLPMPAPQATENLATATICRNL